MISHDVTCYFQVVHDSSRYSHPANWAGYLLMGRDTVLRDRIQPLVCSIRSLLQASQEDYLVAALRHLLSMVSPVARWLWSYNICILQISASVKRISQCDGIMEPKYSTRQAVERKVGAVLGWEELLMATGFHFIHQIKKDVPATIVYPEHDDSGIQRRCQQQLEALLNIPHCLRALSSLTRHPASALPTLNTVSHLSPSLHPPHSLSLPPTHSLSLTTAAVSKNLSGSYRGCPKRGQGSNRAWCMGQSWM